MSPGKKPKPKRPPPPPTPKTQRPWDIPPIPDRGDITEDAIFLSVGRALSQWERLEHQMSNIFAALVSRSADTPARYAYGAVMASATRADMIRGAAHIFFYPLLGTNNAIKRAEFETQKKMLDDLLVEVGQFAGRRNNIAHGVVSPYFRNNATGDGFCLVPPLYATKHYEKRPVYPYAFTSRMIDAFAGHFTRLGEEAHKCAISFYPSG